ncbi:MAG: pyruvate kinase [Treponemataceae bacterium]
MNKTKIICTIGPASRNETMLKKLILAGMNVARINMSHSNQSEHEGIIKLVRKVSVELQVPVGILLDTNGPEVRIKTFNNQTDPSKGFITLEKGDSFTFTTQETEGTKEKVTVTYPKLHQDMKIGERILVSDGLLEFQVEKIIDQDIICKVIQGGKMSSQKGMNFPNKILSMPYLSETDKSDILFGIKNNIDFLACSFTSSKENVAQIRNFLKENGGENIDIISKIENYEGVKNIDDILLVSEGVMIARGDMGVEIPFAKLPAIQKMIIKKCRQKGKRVITATEMLESMIENPRPTRAETNDVANAVFDGSSAIMLSGETAIGKYPEEVVRTMASIALEAENTINYVSRFKELRVEIKNTADAISKATCDAAIELKAKLIVVFTKSGSTARMVSRFRPCMPIIAATFDESVLSKVSLSWGVTPILTKKYTSTDQLFELANHIAKEQAGCKEGDLIAVTAGMPIGDSQGTNILKIIKIS